MKTDKRTAKISLERRGQLASTRLTRSSQAFVVGKVGYVKKRLKQFYRSCFQSATSGNSPGPSHEQCLPPPMKHFRKLQRVKYLCGKEKTTRFPRCGFSAGCRPKMSRKECETLWVSRRTWTTETVNSEVLKIQQSINPSFEDLAYMPPGQSPAKTKKGGEINSGTLSRTPM